MFHNTFDEIATSCAKSLITQDKLMTKYSSSEALAIVAVSTNLKLLSGFYSSFKTG